MTLLFKMFRWLFKKQFDAYIIDRTLRTASTEFTDDQRKYIIKLHEENMMTGILDVLIATFIKAGLKTRTEQGFIQMGDWVTALTHLKDLIVSAKPSVQKLNPLTQTPHKNPKDAE